ncbi:ABC transporter substrate-binding protein, partial [Klebsiella pneumoniae]|uniref:ABC transporter substrate-binding protein n=1 Tax=Klebsiella pneumoniae TaxID=573 RepID=UPI00272F65C0
ISPDGKTYTFHLRAGVAFHSTPWFKPTRPLTADDVVFSFQTLIKDGTPLYRTYYADVDEVIAEDPLRVLFKFKRTNNRELPLILGQLPVLPKHWWATRDFNKSNLEFPLGSGPY